MRSRAVVGCLSILLAAVAFHTASAQDKSKRKSQSDWIHPLLVSADGKRAAAFGRHQKRLRLIDDEPRHEIDLKTSATFLVEGGFSDGDSKLVVSGAIESADRKSFQFCSWIYRLSDGVDLCRADDADAKDAGSFRALAERKLTLSSDGASLLSRTDGGTGVDVFRADTGERRTTIFVGSPIHRVLATSADGGLFIQLQDGPFVRVAADGKVIWRAEPPRERDDTTWSAGERPVAPGRPIVHVPRAFVGDDGARVVVDMEESDKERDPDWEQHIVVAYDWKDGKEIWRRRPDDRDMDEVFFIPSKSYVGVAHESNAAIYRHDTGELVGRLSLADQPDEIVFARTASVGWATTWSGRLFRVDLADLETK